ncbi:MAG: septum formation initiator family protein [Bacteroidales bacterium]|nr:septum formation initiator family protein [Bacteroidales bacterium]
MAPKKGLLSHDGHGYFLPFVVIITAAFAVYILFFSRNSVLNWVKARAEISRQERLIKQYQEENAKIDAEIQSLSQSRDTLEKYAREHFRFASPGDDVYILE